MKNAILLAFVKLETLYPGLIEKEQYLINLKSDMLLDATLKCNILNGLNQFNQ